MLIDPRRRNRLLLACAGGLLALHAAYYYPFVSDDALISLRYARRFSQGLGLTWTDGPPVEGYTDLLWVLLNAASGALGADLIWSARALGSVGALAAVFAASVSPTTGRLDARRLLTGGFVFALTAPLAVWAIGGLEHSFMAGILAAGLLHINRVLEHPRPRGGEILSTGLLFAMLALLRADGILLFALTALGVLLCRGHRWASWRLLLRLALLPTLAVAGQLVFRLAYYGELVPNTALAKVSLNLPRLLYGANHVMTGALALNVLWLGVLIALGVGIRRAPRHRVVVPLVVAIGWAAYVASVGGDIFPGWRQVLLAIVPLVMLVAEGGRRVRLRRRRARLAGLFALVVALPGYLALQMIDSENRRAKGELWEWSGESLGNLLKRAFEKRQPLLAVDAGGSLPYWSELPSLDMLGLNDKYIASHPPKNFGRGALGHELGDGIYVWRQRPDIIAFNGAAGAAKPLFVSGRQLMRHRKFHTTYHLIRARGNRGRMRTTGELYLRYEGGPLGIQRTPKVVRIPGYLFSHTIPRGARLDARDRLVTPIQGLQAGRINRVRLTRGIWQLAVSPPSPAATAAFLCRRRAKSVPQSARPERTRGLPALRVRRQTYVDIVVALPAGSETTLFLEEVTLTRAPGSKAVQSCPSRRRVRQAALADLAEPRAEGTYYAYPGNVTFSRPGLRVTLPRSMTPTTLDISLDRNDSYRLRYELDGELIDASTVGPAEQGSGLAVYRVYVPESVRDYGTDRIVIVPRKGDGHYSVGHLLLSEGTDESSR